MDEKANYVLINILPCVWIYIYLLLQTKIKDTFTRIKHGGAREIHRKV